MTSLARVKMRPRESHLTLKAYSSLSALMIVGALTGWLSETAQARSLFPPHHRLWTCIQRFEGAWHDHGPGHYGGLQMTWNWLGYVRGDAGALSQSDQEWAAERAWRASDYSYSFLVGQWYAWDGADGCGTTG